VSQSRSQIAFDDRSHPHRPKGHRLVDAGKVGPFAVVLLGDDARLVDVARRQQGEGVEFLHTRALEGLCGGLLEHAVGRRRTITGLRRAPHIAQCDRLRGIPHYAAVGVQPVVVDLCHRRDRLVRFGRRCLHDRDERAQRMSALLGAERQRVLEHDACSLGIMKRP
jgi:hypothetical protein